VEDEETKAWLALALCATGRPDEWLALARRAGGAPRVVAATDDELVALGASSEAVARLRDAWPRQSDRLLERCRRLAIRVAAIDGPGYPAVLAGIPNPPLVLFWRGAEPESCAPAVAVVGARRSTDYGERTAHRIGREAAEAGAVVVSGLARGIDAAAHRGALETGRTAAVLAGGLDQIYPGEHTSLADRIAGSGGFLLSEQPPGNRPRRGLFPYRNRLITGLCQALVVVEASMRSGSLASARHALDQGRDVFAVPGPIDSPLSEGANSLLAQGAAPFCRTRDLAAVRGWSGLFQKPQRKSSEMKEFLTETLGPESASVLAAIEAGATTPDEIAAATRLDGTRVLTQLTALELDGLVRREAHGRFRARP
jgi:DNA processing protein